MIVVSCGDRSRNVDVTQLSVCPSWKEEMMQQQQLPQLVFALKPILQLALDKHVFMNAVRRLMAPRADIVFAVSAGSRCHILPGSRAGRMEGHFFFFFFFPFRQQ